jgi:hypothetical protein
MAPNSTLVLHDYLSFFEKKLRGDSIAQKLHLLPDAEVVKGRLGQHQVNKQLGPTNGELETHQAVRSDLLDTDKPACDFASEPIRARRHRLIHARLPECRLTARRTLWSGLLVK